MRIDMEWADEVDCIADELAAEAARLRLLAGQIRDVVSGTEETVECIALAERVLYEEPLVLPLASTSLPSRSYRC